MEKEDNRILFGLVGYGHIGRRHAEALQTNPRTRLLAVADPAFHPAETPAFQHYESPEQLLRTHPEIDVVVIATPNGMHEEHACLALRAGKHVVIEKPMALSKAGCERILYEALQQSRQVFCVMQNRYSPVVQWLREVLANNLLGRIYTVNVDLYWNRDDRYYTPGSWHGTKAMDGGPLFTQFAHFIDLLYWLFGEWTPLRADFRNEAHQHNTEFEDTGWVQFQLAGGAHGSLFYTTAAWDKNFESTIVLLGENGVVKIGGQYMDRLEYVHMANPLDFHPPAQPFLNGHYQVLDNAVRVLRGEERIGTNALEGMKVVELIEHIYGLQKR